MVANNFNYVEIRYDIDDKIKFYLYCNNCCFKKCSAANEEEISHLFKDLNEEEMLDYYLFIKEIQKTRLYSEKDMKKN